MSVTTGIYPARQASSSKTPHLSINTSRTNSRSASPVKSTVHKLYELPTALESPLPSFSARRHRPGGLAARHSDGDARSVLSGRTTPMSRRGSEHALIRGLASPGPLSPRPECSGPSKEKLQLFAHHCRAFYFAADPSPESAGYISSTLASASPADRAAYSKLQAALRSLAHLHHLRIRISAFYALLSSTYVSGSLAPASRAAVNSAPARFERKDKLRRIIDTWCSGSGAGGVEPFFRGLWAVMRVQSRYDPGRGNRRVVWEIDDAVFLESGGLEFMHVAIILLKGVLGFNDTPLSTPPRLRRVRTLPRTFAEARSGRIAPSYQNNSVIDDAVSRSRAVSDPFVDSRMAPKARTSSGGPAPPPPASQRTRPLQYPVTNDVESLDSDERELLLMPDLDIDDTAGTNEDLTEHDVVAEEEALNRPNYRLWTFPAHITDQEAEDLMSLFPRSFSKTDARLPYVPPGHGSLGAETNEGWLLNQLASVRVPSLEAESREGVLRYGTGRMWTGTEMRNAKSAGSTWFRFTRWCRRLFGLG